MGEHRPELEELVLYHRSAEESVIAKVVNVIAWDLADIQFEDGTVMENVRRVFIWNESGILTREVWIGRWERLTEDYEV